MRFLITTCPAPGHLFLLVPVGWALRNAGHEVLLPVTPSLGAAARGTGLATTAVADVDMMEVMARNFAPALRAGMANVDPRERAAYGVNAFTELADRVADDVVAIGRAWRPDVVVHDATEFAGPLVAAALGAPTVAVGWGTWLREPVLSMAAEAMGRVYSRHSAGSVGTTSAERVDVCPRSLREDPDDPVLQARFEPYNGSGMTPSRFLGTPQRRRICVTLGGSVGSQQRMATGLLAPVLAAVDGIDAEVVLALGDLDASELGTLPANVSAEHWLPLNQVLPGCDLVLHHAGSGTSLTAARFGVPQLVFPQLADQFRLATRLAETGAGTVVDVRAAGPGTLREQLQRLLDDPAPRAAAATLAREMAATPALTELVPTFEDPKPS